MAGAIPLVESGTAGYLGQVQPLKVRPTSASANSSHAIEQDRTECFDCILKPTPTTFPVRTIRSTPSQSTHGIVWAKSYLMGSVALAACAAARVADAPTCHLRSRPQPVVRRR